MGLGGRREYVGIFGMHDHHPAEQCQFPQVRFQLGCAQRRELVDVGVRPKVLKPKNSGTVQRA
ncbi:hypothetical protein [Amycolatopsis taiwanensis]|uniref:Uncharacterized protein n=1 Tax=Amycolatopsis taiwanensis TaxID=342230 RepID=A0A9W6RC51_9PSEU|nr:hypothetical protein [Amycolatopsis taiwanensis]GLY71337.1 hypothetical protein Atai01_79560 [Amycolatopsis taiwanensis]